ncbi:unnamed protein product [Adineta ricciae]|uniref:AB hydrolase-1 domain-containing protein n=1 Tax=Adineta ricciae TaxID=249248 RepID=A0A814WEX2_ADIRI|nr:unnamed protein product [Adineta ricciae]CAF1562356.1 unnamed protein product [Adineta ricciae]
MMIPTYFYTVLVFIKILAGSASSIADRATAQTVLIRPGISYEYIHINATNDKPTILFLHGFPSSLHSWRHQTKYFSEQGYGCLVPNLMGYGRSYSPLNRNEYTSKTITDHLIILLDRVGLGKSSVFVIGHDWGARTASRFVLYHPERTIGAALLSVAYSPPFRFNLNAALQQSLTDYGYESIGYWTFFAADDAARIIERNVDSFIDLLFAANATLARTDVAPVGKIRAWLNNNTRTDRATYMTKEDYGTLREYLASGMQPKLNWFHVVIDNLDWDYEKTFNATVRRPVLYIGGRRDYIGIIGAAERQNAYVKDLKIVEVDTGHWVMEEKPNEVNREIHQWIKTVMSNNSPTITFLWKSYLYLFILFLFLTI